MAKRVPPHQRCGSKERARHAYNLKKYREQYVRDSGYEPDLIQDSVFITDTLHPVERKEMQQK